MLSDLIGVARVGEGPNFMTGDTVDRNLAKPLFLIRFFLVNTGFAELVFNIYIALIGIQVDDVAVLCLQVIC